MIIKKYKILGKEVYKRFKSYTICDGCQYNDNNGGCLYSTNKHRPCKIIRLSKNLINFRYRPK